MHGDPQPLERRFEELLGLYAPALRRLCAAHRRDSFDQKDLFQEIALAVWAALPRFRGDSSERTWIYRIAHNIALTDFARQRRRRGREVELEEERAGAVPADNDRRKELLDALRRLDPVERELATLYLEGLTTREIGDVLGITEGNAAVRLTRLRQRLTEMLNPKESKV